MQKRRSLDNSRSLVNWDKFIDSGRLGSWLMFIEPLIDWDLKESQERRSKNFVLPL